VVSLRRFGASLVVVWAFVDVLVLFWFPGFIRCCLSFGDVWAPWPPFHG